MKSPLIIVCCLLMVCVFATAQEPCPQVIPALQQWKGGKGELALPAEGSIVLSPADEATLSPTAQILAQDLKELFGTMSSKPENQSGKTSASHCRNRTRNLVKKDIR